MKERGWPTDDIDYWFKDLRDDEPNSEEEEEALGGPPMPDDPPAVSGIMLHTHSPSVHVALVHIDICAGSVWPSGYSGIDILNPYSFDVCAYQCHAMHTRVRRRGKKRKGPDDPEADPPGTGGASSSRR